MESCVCYSQCLIFCCFVDPCLFAGEYLLQTGSNVVPMWMVGDGEWPAQWKAATTAAGGCECCEWSESDQTAKTQTRDRCPLVDKYKYNGICH